MRSDNFRRMAELASAIPTNYLKKSDTAVLDPAEAKAEILGHIKTVADDLKQVRADLEECRVKGQAAPESLKAELKTLIARMDQIDAQLQSPDREQKQKPQGGPGIFDELMQKNAVQEWRERGHHGQGFSVKMERSLFPESFRKEVLSTGVPGPDQWMPRIMMPLLEELRIRDIMTVVPTTESVIKYVKESGFTGGASPQVEGAVKNESNITFTDESAEVRTIATWIAISKQAIDDNAQLQTYVEGRLRYAVKLEEEEQILTGDDTGENLDGIIPQATAFDGGGISEGSDTELDTILAAATQLRLANAPHEGTVVHPTDYGKMRKVKTDEGTTANRGAYLWGNPGSDPFMLTMLWGRPCVVTTAIPQGDFLVGAFRSFSWLFDRQQLQIDISASHADFFTKNKFAIRAEERVAVAVMRPEAFVYGQFV